MVTFTLLVVGGLNWLVSALFGWELGADLLGGADTTLAKAVYVLVGLSAVYEAMMHGKHCKMCKSGSQPSSPMPGQM
jgi:hypothetical protein